MHAGFPSDCCYVHREGGWCPGRRGLLPGVAGSFLSDSISSRARGWVYVFFTEPQRRVFFRPLAAQSSAWCLTLRHGTAESRHFFTLVAIWLPRGSPCYIHVECFDPRILPALGMFLFPWLPGFGFQRTATNARGWYDDELTKQTRDWKEGFDVGHVPHPGLPPDHPSNIVVEGFNQWPGEVVPLFKVRESSDMLW